MSIDSSNPNLAKESGGNLDVAAQMLKYMQQLVHIAENNKAILKAIQFQLINITGAPGNAGAFFGDDTTNG